MPREGTGDSNAELAVSLFNDLLDHRGWGLDRAWLAISQLLMTCQVWENGEWTHFADFPVLMERNEYRPRRGGADPRATRDAKAVGDRLASELGLTSRSDLPAALGLFFRQNRLSQLQPNNPRGHAFRSLVAETLARFGDPGLTISEERSPHAMFPGYRFDARSSEARIDIVAQRGAVPVALISTRWTYRHDRVDMIEEARAYIPAARSLNRNCVYYGVTAEFGQARLKKVILQTEAVERYASLRRLVHLNPELASSVVGRNGQLAHLMSLEQMVTESTDWR